MDEMQVRVFAIALAMALFTIFHRFYVRWRFNARKGQMRELAARNKWRYTDEKTGIDVGLAESRIMKFLGEFRFQSFIEPPADEYKIWISDFYPAIGNAFVASRGSGATHVTLSCINRTILVVEDPEFSLPHFFLRPETLLADQLYKAVGDQDINFDNDPVFSKAFILQGKNEEQTRELFDHKVRSSLVYYASDGLMVEGLGKFILLYQDRLQEIDQIESLLEKLKEIRKIFRTRNYRLEKAEVEFTQE